MDVLVPQKKSDLVYTDTGCQWHTVLVSHIEGEDAVLLKYPSSGEWAVDDDGNEYSTVVSSDSYCQLSTLTNTAKAWSGCGNHGPRLECLEFPGGSVSKGAEASLVLRSGAVMR